MKQDGPVTPRILRSALYPLSDRLTSLPLVFKLLLPIYITSILFHLPLDLGFAMPQRRVVMEIIIAALEWNLE